MCIRDRNYCGSHSSRDENDKISAAGLTLTSRHSIPFIDEGNMILLCEKMSATRLTEDSFLMPEIAQKWYADHDMHTMYIAVSYTHLDVYKRQEFHLIGIFRTAKFKRISVL